jgi:hypothetical protein
MADRIVGVFRDLEHARRAIGDLETAGFPAARISLTSGEVPDEPEAHDPDDSYTREGAIVGAIVIGTVGAAMAFSGMSLSPQVPVFNVLPHQIFTPLLMGTAGWLAGGIIGLGVARDREIVLEPHREISVAVQAPGRTEEVRAIFAYNGVLDVRGADAVELAARA